MWGGLWGLTPPPSLKSMAYGDFQAPTDPDLPTWKEKNVSPPGQMCTPLHDLSIHRYFNRVTSYREKHFYQVTYFKF